MKWPVTYGTLGHNGYRGPNSKNSTKKQNKNHKLLTYTAFCLVQVAKIATETICQF